MLTDLNCRSATCPTDKPRARFSDSGGLYLEVSLNGSKRWFFKFRSGGKEKRLALGSYPEVSLTQARKARDIAKAQKAQGVDPVQHRKAQKHILNQVGDTFAEIALDMLNTKKTGWGDTHTLHTEALLKNDLIPYLGDVAIQEIKVPELISVLRRIEEKGSFAKLKKARSVCGMVWRYAVQSGKADNNIALGLAGAFKTRTEKHFSAITEPLAFGQLLRTIDTYQGGPVVRVALQLAPLLFQRPGELRGMRWDEIDFDKALWTIPAARMKRTLEGKENGEPHLVPLSKQTLTFLNILKPITGNGELVFPGEKRRDQPISDATLGKALRSLGYSSDIQTAHGFRASARTMLSEQLDIDPLVIEQQLAHTVKDALGRAYNRTTYLKQRAEMMQTWADYLDDLKQKAKAQEAKGSPQSSTKRKGKNG